MFLGGAKLVLGGGKTPKKFSRSAVLSEHVFKVPPPGQNPVYAPVSSSLYTLSKLSKTTYPNELVDFDCVTLYVVLDSFNMVYRDEDSILYQMYKSKYFRAFILKI